MFCSAISLSHLVTSRSFLFLLFLVLIESGYLRFWFPAVSTDYQPIDLPLSWLLVFSRLLLFPFSFVFRFFGVSLRLSGGKRRTRRARCTRCTRCTRRTCICRISRVGGASCVGRATRVRRSARFVCRCYVRPRSLSGEGFVERTESEPGEEVDGVEQSSVSRRGVVGRRVDRTQVALARPSVQRVRCFVRQILSFFDRDRSLERLVDASGVVAYVTKTGFINGIIGRPGRFLS